MKMTEEPIRFHTDLERNLRHPLVRAWFPKGENLYGHVSIQTNNYYMSFWPDGSLTEKKSHVKAGLSGVKASLHFHPDYDCTVEGNRRPDKRIYVKFVSCSDLDKLYEEFLAYNDVNPSAVNLQRGCDLRDRGEIPAMAIDRTAYTFLPNLKYKNSRPFYWDGQSCVSFVYHMIEWTKRDISVTVTIEFFKNLFKILDAIMPPVEREVNVHLSSIFKFQIFFTSSVSIFIGSSI